MRSTTPLHCVMVLGALCVCGCSEPPIEMATAVESIEDSSRLVGRPPELDDAQLVTPGPLLHAHRGDALTVAVVSDMNGRYGSTSYHQAVHGAVSFITGTLRPDLVITTGDMVAGQRRGLDYASMWRAFHDAVTEPLREASIPFAPAPGNHDGARASRFSPERHHYINEWAVRRPDVDFVDDRHYPLHYAFRKGPALFIAIDATVVGKLDRAQRAWLSEVLARHDDVPVKIVYGHVPIYPFADNKKREILDDPDLERLFQRYDVDIVLSGHHHAYYPGQRGPMRMLGMPCLGAGRRVLVGDDVRSKRSVVVLEIEDKALKSVEAYLAPRFTKRVLRSKLPRSLNSGRMRIWRDDLVGHHDH